MQNPGHTITTGVASASMLASVVFGMVAYRNTNDTDAKRLLLIASLLSLVSAIILVTDIFVPNLLLDVSALILMLISAVIYVFVAVRHPEIRTVSLASLLLISAGIAAQSLSFFTTTTTTPTPLEPIFDPTFYQFLKRK